MSEDWREDRVASAAAGTNPTVLRLLPGGYAVIGDVQFLPGYCVLLTRVPGAGRLTDLTQEQRSAFLASMDVLGEAVEIVCARRDPGFRRINLEIQGNELPVLHAHIWPRYTWEPETLHHRPVALHPAANWLSGDYDLDERHAQLRQDLTVELARLDR